MTYLVFILFVIIYSKYVSFFKVRNWNSIKYLPIYLLFIIILGLQFKVGTDYNSYLELASTNGDFGWIENKFEFSFVFLNKIVISLGWPQLIFFFAAVIQIFFLSKIVNDLEIIYELKSVWFFFFFFTLSLIFFNSFNGIRQYIAIYISFYSFIKLIQGKNIFFILGILFASSFHSSALFLLMFFLLRPLLFVKFNFYFILLTILFSGYFGLFYLQNLITEYIGLTQYGEYLKSDYFYLEIDPINILTKLPKVLVVLICAFFLETKYNDISDKYKPLLNLSYLSLIFLMFSLFSPMLWRFYQYFDIFLIFPPLILFSYNRQRDLSYILSAFLFFILLLKILIFNDYEYSYNSILFNN
jgi:transmembrane protein EpsG